jgi:hypothetical protein
VSWYFYSDLRRFVGKATITPEERVKQEKEWFEERLRDGKKLSKCLPIQGELNWTNAECPPTPAILPEHAISRLGLINEIWVPGGNCEIRIGNSSCIGVYQHVPIGYYRTRFRVYRGFDTDILLLSYRKLKVVPYLWKDQTVSPRLKP